MKYKVWIGGNKRNIDKLKTNHICLKEFTGIDGFYGLRFKDALERFWQEFESSIKYIVIKQTDRVDSQSRRKFLMLYGAFSDQFSCYTKRNHKEIRLYSNRKLLKPSRLPK